LKKDVSVLPQWLDKAAPFYKGRETTRALFDLGQRKVFDLLRQMLILRPAKKGACGNKLHWNDFS